MPHLPNRRDVLKTGAAVALAAAPLAIAAAPNAAPSRPKRPWKKAVMWGMIGNRRDQTLSVLDKFKMLKDAGFDGVEMNAPSDTPNDEILKACQATGIEIEGVVDSVHWRQTLTHNNPQMRAEGLKALLQAIKDCKAIGGTSVLLVPGVVDETVPYDVCYQRSQEAIKQALPLAGELGIKIAIENVWNKFHLSPLECAHYVDELNHSAAAWHFDIGNVMAFGWPEQWIRILGKRIVKIHVKEFSRTKQNEEGMRKGFGVELLEGDNNWPAIMKALDEVGYNTWACIEMPGGDLERLKKLSHQLDRILAM